MLRTPPAEVALTCSASDRFHHLRAEGQIIRKRKVHIEPLNHILCASAQPPACSATLVCFRCCTRCFARGHDLPCVVSSFCKQGSRSRRTKDRQGHKRHAPSFHFGWAHDKKSTNMNTTFTCHVRGWYTGRASCNFFSTRILPTFFPASNSSLRTQNWLKN